MPKRSPEAKARRREKNRVYMQQARQRARTIIVEAKSKPCMDCGGSWPSYVMHFDHVRGTKEFTIAGYVTAISNSQLAFDRLFAEIAKCDVVCANCHALRHGGQFI
jgi:hypothetical protein